jgi:hypothetical protein
LLYNKSFELNPLNQIYYNEPKLEKKQRTGKNCFFSKKYLFIYFKHKLFNIKEQTGSNQARANAFHHSNKFQNYKKTQLVIIVFISILLIF